MKRSLKAFLCAVLTLVMLIVQTVYPAVGLLPAQAESDLIRGEFHYAGMYKATGDATLDYVYSDTYFDAEAQVYNPSLSTMSLALEMSSWSSLDEANWADKTVNARELLTDIGFTDFAQNDFWADAPTVNSIGAVAARKQLEDSTLIALAVRGGGYFSEWGSNVLIGANDEHTGFATARDNVVAFLKQYVADCSITGRVKVWLVGFSRGGAVANMTAGYLNQYGLTNEATLTPADLYCYTFEAPQGTQSTGADASYSNIHNIINPNDIVPLVAPGDWGFARFNETSHLLPTITTTYYTEAFEQMLLQYADILKGVDLINPEEASYNIAEYAKTLEMQINYLSFLPGGAPFIELKTVENTHLPQAIMLTESVSALVEAAKSRERFHENIETDVSTLLGELLSANQNSTLSDYIRQLGAVLTEDNYANLIYVLEPVIQLSVTSMEDRMAAVAERLREILPQPEGYEDIVGTVGSLADLMATLLSENPQALLNLVLSLSSTNMIQAHYAEITMAWLRIEDPNFTDQPFTSQVPEAMRIVRVNCPVDLYVYNSEDELVASIIGGVATTMVNGIGCALNPDGEMVVYLPSDAEFRIEIVATGDGSVSCSVNEFNVVRNQHTYVVNYPPVAIANGDSLTALFPKLDDAQYTDELRQGSDAPYALLDQSDIPVDPASVLRGGDVAQYTVRAERSNAFGQVMGGGKYVSGSFAQLEAYPVSGSSFLGWYAGEELVSSSAVYRFAVSEDVTLTARFSEATLYQVDFSAQEGGSIGNVSGSYTAGTHLALSAAASKGYEFSGWSVSAGELTTYEDGSVFFIVPSENATVTAAFTQTGEICPNCKQVMPEGIHHNAPCGLDHYSCTPDYRASEHRYCPLCGNGYYCTDGHGFGSGECGMQICEGCNDEIRITESHASACGVESHFTCADGYAETDHAACEHCGAYLCNGGEHTLCPLCNEGYLCMGGHGTDKGQCSYVETYACSACGEIIPLTESHLSSCGHYSCSADYAYASHSYHAACRTYRCNGAAHGICSLCGDGYVCEGGHGTNEGQCSYTESYICFGCEQPVSDPDEHLAPCGEEEHFTCAEDYDESEHVLCEICGLGYICLAGHGFEYGECGNPDTSAPSEPPESTPTPSPTPSPAPSDDPSEAPSEEPSNTVTPTPTPSPTPYVT